MLHLNYVNLAEPRGPLGHLLAISDSPAQDEDHIKWPSLRAELAINLISGLSGRGPHPYDYSVMFGSASTSNGEISPRSNLRRATSAIMAALSVQADKGGTVTRIP